MRSDNSLPEKSRRKQRVISAMVAILPAAAAIGEVQASVTIEK